jgi:hypothetical protein
MQIFGFKPSFVRWYVYMHDKVDISGRLRFVEVTCNIAKTRQGGRQKVPEGGPPSIVL